MDLAQVRRTYSKEFKEETIQLVLTLDMRVSEVSKDLGIGTATIYRWIWQVAKFRFIEAQSSIIKFIMVLYNRRRRHSYLNYLSPFDFE